MTEPPWMSAADVAGRECWCAVLPARTRVAQSRHLARGPGGGYCPDLGDPRHRRLGPRFQYRVRLPRTLCHRTGGPRMGLHDLDLLLGERRQEPSPTEGDCQRVPPAWRGRQTVKRKMG